MMKMFKKKMDGEKKPFSNSGKYGLGTVAKTVKTQGEMKSAPKKSAAPAPKEKRVSTLKRIVKDVPTKRVPVSKLTRSVKTVSVKAPMTASDSAGVRHSKLKQEYKEAMMREDSARAANGMPIKKRNY